MAAAKRKNEMRKNRILKILIGILIVSFPLNPLNALDWGFKFGLNNVHFTFSDKDLQSDFSSRQELFLGAFVSFDLFKKLFNPAGIELFGKRLQPCGKIKRRRHLQVPV
jgi:hypothetical protein